MIFNNIAKLKLEALFVGLTMVLKLLIHWMTTYSSS